MNGREPAPRRATPVVRLRALAFVALAVLALVSLTRGFLKDLAGIDRTGRTPVPPVTAGRVYAELRNHLTSLPGGPPREVGFVTDRPYTTLEVHHHALQYVLAPTLVRPRTGPALLISSFDSEAAAVAAIPSGYSLERDFGGGIRLHRRSPG